MLLLMSFFLSELLFFAALHLAVMQGRLNNVRVLLTESTIDAEAFNLRYFVVYRNPALLTCAILDTKIYD